MMYLVEGEPLEWFTGKAHHSVESKAGATSVRRRRLYKRVSNLSDCELAEMVGNYIYSETGDYYFAADVVAELAARLGVRGDLRGDGDE